MKNIISIIIVVSIALSLNLHGEVKKVDVVNTKTGQTYSSTFGTYSPIEKMQSWLDEMNFKALKCKGWGCKKDIEITITDLTSQHEAEQAAKEARKTEISQIKQAIDLIDSSDKPVWEKKLLKRLVLELKE